MERESYENGYLAGERCNLYEEIKIPAELSTEEKMQFMRGFDDAISDRIS